MNIAFLTSEYPHPKINHAAGIGTSIKNLASGLIANSHKVTIFVYGQEDDEVFMDGLVEIHKIKHIRYALFGWFLYRKYLQKYMNAYITKNNIQLIEAPDWTGITAFIKFKCPLIIRLHGSDAYFCHLEGRKQKTKNYFFEKKALNQADNIISVSAFTSLKTKEIFKISRPIEIIHNGVNVAQFSNSNKEVESNSILYFGSVIRKKGVLELAHIFNKVIEKLPQAKLTLLGKDVSDILTKTSTLDLFTELLSINALKNFTYIDQVPYDEVHDYIEKASVIVLPSFAEAFPMTWLEAMAMGKALVTSDIGWANEIMIDGETGFMENPKSHQLFANKIIDLSGNKMLNTTFGNNAKQHIVTNFSQKNTCKKNIEYYKSII